MNWERVTREWRRVRDYVKSKLESGEGDSQDDDDTSLLGKDWPSNDGRFAFPSVLEPALARIPRR